LRCFYECRCLVGTQDFRKRSAASRSDESFNGIRAHDALLLSVSHQPPYRNEHPRSATCCESAIIEIRTEETEVTASDFFDSVYTADREMIAKMPQVIRVGFDGARRETLVDGNSCEESIAALFDRSDVMRGNVSHSSPRVPRC